MRFVARSEVGFIIPTYNDRLHLSKTIELLRGMTYDEAVVVVVNDGSSDGTTEMLAEVDDIVSIEGGGDLWWSGAINAGARELESRGAEILVMWNDDNIAASSKCIEDIVAHVVRTSDCVSPVLLQKGAEGEQIVRHRGGETDWPRGGVRLREFGTRYQSSDHTDTVSWLPGNALVLSLDRFREVGGVDERTFPQYRGDADLTMRIVEQGARCVVLNWCWVENDAGRTGLFPTRRIGPRSFVRGLTSVRSSDQVSSTVSFVFRHCPTRRLAIWCVAIYYMKYVYWCMKTWRP